MRHKANCSYCQLLVIAYTNAMQVAFNSLFDGRGVSSRTTPKATWNRFDGHCIYCGQETDWGLRSRSLKKQAARDLYTGQTPQIDHWIPASLGGPPTMWNMVLACRACNISKGNKLRPYPPALLLNDPELEERTGVALELARLAWGDFASAGGSIWVSCEVANHIALSWQRQAFSLGSSFPHLTQLLIEWNPSYCNSASQAEVKRLAIVLEREAEKALHF